MKEKQNRDNRQKKVPDKASELVGSDLIIHLQEQVKTQFPALLEEALSRPHNARVQWLLSRLESMEDEQAQAILSVYTLERTKTLLVRAQEKRYKRLRQHRKQIEAGDAESQQYYQERINRIEQEIEEADQQNGPLLSVDEIQRLLTEQGHC